MNPGRIISLMMLTAGLPLAAPGQATPTRGFWVSAGGGFQSDGSQFASSIGAHGQRNGLLVSVRQDAVGAGSGSGKTATGIQIGLASTTPFRSAGFSAGIATVDVTGYFDGKPGVHRRSPGAMLAADFALRAGRRGGAGLGVTGFVNINGRAPFAGFALDLSAGKWR